MHGGFKMLITESMLIMSSALRRTATGFQVSTTFACYTQENDSICVLRDSFTRCDHWFCASLRCAVVDSCCCSCKHANLIMASDRLCDPFEVDRLRVRYGAYKGGQCAKIGVRRVVFSTCSTEDFEDLVEEGEAEIRKVLPQRIACQKQRASFDVMTAQGKWESCRGVDPVLVLWKADMLERKKCPEHKSKFIVPDGAEYTIRVRKVSEEAVRQPKGEAFALAGELVSDGNPEVARQQIRKVRSHDDEICVEQCFWPCITCSSSCMVLLRQGV
jgi:hypothetical protein